jgi:hypothetical protein
MLVENLGDAGLDCGEFAVQPFDVACVGERELLAGLADLVAGAGRWTAAAAPWPV